MTAGTYEVRNKLDGMAYGGSSGEIEQRWSAHRRMLRKDCHFNPRLQNAWNKYGKESFEFIILEVIEDHDERIAAEQVWLDIHHANGTCYNIAITAGPAGPMAEETKQKISASLIGELHPMWGKHLTDAHKHNISVANMGNQNLLGYKHTEEVKQRQSERMTGPLNPNWGKQPSEETRRKISAAKTGERHPNWGKRHSEETRRKQSIANMGERNHMWGKKHTDAAKRKQSEAKKLWWAKKREKDGPTDSAN